MSSRHGRRPTFFESTHVTDIDVETVDLMTVGSYRMNLGHIRLISDAVADLLARETDPIDGIVITHGTDTTEETAVLLDLVHDDPRPVVLTGAQRASDAADGDGPRNLADAILVAASPRARGLGVLIAFAGRVLPARGTRKVHTAALVGVRFGHRRSSRRRSRRRLGGRSPRHRGAPLRCRGPPRTFDHTRVDLVEMYPGADDALMRAAVAAGARGIVVAGTGIGNANPVVVDAARAMVAGGVAVVLSTRVPEGPVAGVYGDGGGADLVAAGIPAASGLPATQLRMLLALWLSQHEVEASEIRSMIACYADDKEG